MKRIGLLFSLTLISCFTLGQTAYRIYPDEQNFPANPGAIEIVIMGDGYTTSYLSSGTFDIHANDVKDQLLNNFSPFKEYKNYFNVYRMDIPASNAQVVGDNCATVDCPEHPVTGQCETVNTNSHYSASHDGLSPPPFNSPIHRFATADFTLIQQELLNNGFDLDRTFVILLINCEDIYYPFSPDDVHFLGGGHPNFHTCITPAATHYSNVATSLDEFTAIHEFAHSFANLRDEYWTPDSEAWAEDARNMSDSETDVPWEHWRFNSTWLEGIGIHAHYNTIDNGTYLNLHGYDHFQYDLANGIQSWFKPTTNYSCALEDFHGVEFCAVCREVFVQRIHGLTHPVSSFSPGFNQANVNQAINEYTVQVDIAEPTYFSIDPIYTLTSGGEPDGSLDIEWTLGGQPYTAVWTSNEGRKVVTLGCDDIPPGQPTELVVTVKDNTRFGYAVSDPSDPKDGQWIRHDDSDDPNAQTPITHDFNTFKITWEITNQNQPDLWIQDRPSDVGVVDLQASLGWPLDEAPGIWTSNLQGSLVHGSLDYSQPTVYANAIVKNRGCASSDKNRELGLHFTHSTMGNQVYPGSFAQIGSNQTIGVSLAPGEQSDPIEFEWDLANSLLLGQLQQNDEVCVLGIIDDAPYDLTLPYTDWNHLGSFIYYNNNVAHRNTVVTDFSIEGPTVVDGNKLPPGAFTTAGNPHGSNTIKEDITFSIDDAHTGKPLTDEAEVYLYFKNGYFDISTVIDDSNLEGMKNVKPGLYLITEDQAAIRNIDFPAGAEVKMYLGFSFLTKEVESNPYFQYHVRQMRSNDGRPTGAVHYDLIRDPRYLFEADAGDDKEVNKDEQVTVEAEDILEDAVYNWYDMDGNLIYSGMDLTVTADITKRYRLEVISEIDGYKDYSEVEVKVKMGEITNINPNPANNQTTVSYHTQGGSSAYIAVFNVITGNSDQYILPLGQGSLQLDLMNYQTGSYEVLLVTDGEVRDNQSLMVE